MKKIYLAIPYGGMEDSSYQQAKEAVAAIMREGHNPISLIVYGHPLTFTGLDVPGDWEYWEEIGHQYLDWCDEVWVLVPNEGMHKVEDSTGVQGEISYGVSSGMPVRYFEHKNGHLIEKKINEDHD